MTGDNYNVPNVLYFDFGYALHGADWHNNFGTPMSHVCVNLPLGNALWLFEWTQIGTPVIFTNSRDERLFASTTPHNFLKIFD